MAIYSFSPFGYEGALVNIEVDLRRGIPAVDIVGLADGAVKESRERMRAAIRNSGFEFPSERVLMSLSPADLKKEGAGFDLPMALAVLCAKEDYPVEQKTDVLVMGELELSGNVRPVKGVYPALSTSVASGIQYAIVPKDCEVAVPQGMKVFYVETLEDAYRTIVSLDKGDKLENFVPSNVPTDFDNVEFEDYEGMNLDDIKGRNGLKFAMAVAVAGRHHIMAWGSPGCGKTMVLQCMPQITPKLRPQESFSVTRIWSLAGLLRGSSEYVRTRPFRMPHQTASIEGICGGGPNCRPGEISLAHNGTLFLDEAAEFRSSVLQMLRVPLETGTITLSRAGRTTVFPAHFQLVMATNPCPCGNYGSKEKICLCSAKSVDLYWKKFSAPLLDRITIRYNCSEEDKYADYSVEDLRRMIKRACERQYKRQDCLNQDLDPKGVSDFCQLTQGAARWLDKQTLKYGYSPREISGLLKVARTLCDMHEEECDTIGELYIKMAVQLHSQTPLFE